MKIIGTAGRDEYIVTMSERELANCAGYEVEFGDFQTDMTRIGAYHNGRVRTGADIPVEALSRHVASLRQRESEVKRAAASLRGLADLMDGALPAVVAPGDAIIPPLEEERGA